MFLYALLILCFKPYKKLEHDRADLLATSVGGITIILAIFIHDNIFPAWVGLALFFMGNIIK